MRFKNDRNLRSSTTIATHTICRGSTVEKTSSCRRTTEDPGSQPELSGMQNNPVRTSLKHKKEEYTAEIDDTCGNGMSDGLIKRTPSTSPQIRPQTSKSMRRPQSSTSKKTLLTMDCAEHGLGD